MCPVLEPMTYEDLTQLSREEIKSKSLMQCRPDLYRALADLLTRLRKEYDKEVARDPDSVMCEGANLRRQNAEKTARALVSLRTRKICERAVNSADGGNVQVDALTPEEREYFNSVTDLSKRQLALVNRYRGKLNTVDTHIDEPVVRTEAPRETVPEEPAPVVEDVPKEMPETEEIPFEESFDDIPEEEMPMDEPADVPLPEKTGEASAPVEENEEPVEERAMPGSKVIRILEDLPKFVGPDRDYELFKEDVVTLPEPMALALVNAQKAVLINPGS